MLGSSFLFDIHFFTYRCYLCNVLYASLLIECNVVLWHKGHAHVDACKHALPKRVSFNVHGLCNHTDVWPAYLLNYNYCTCTPSCARPWLFCMCIMLESSPCTHDVCGFQPVKLVVNSHNFWEGLKSFLAWFFHYSMKTNPTLTVQIISSHVCFLSSSKWRFLLSAMGLMLKLILLMEACATLGFLLLLKKFKTVISW